MSESDEESDFVLAGVLSESTTPSTITMSSVSISSSSTHFAFSKGAKGKLTTKHSYPRKIVKNNDISIICLLMGGEDNVKLILGNFNEINESKTAESQSRADGVISSTKSLYHLSDRNVKMLFNIGSHRLSRIKNNQDKKKPGGLNGSQVIYA
jgi:hypothetical protein